MCFEHGTGVVQGATIFKDFEGPIRFDVLSQRGGSRIMINTNCSFNAPLLACSRCHLSGLWRYDQGLFSLKNDDRSLVIGPVRLYRVGVRLCSEVCGHIPLAFLHRLVINDCDHSPLSGSCTVHTNIDVEGGVVHVGGRATVGQVRYNETPVVASSKILFSRSNTCWNGSLLCTTASGHECGGTFNWDERDSIGTFAVHNDSMIDFPADSYWSFLPKTISIKGSRTADNQLQATYCCTARHKKTEDTFAWAGSVSWADRRVKLEGTAEGKKFCLICKTDPFHVHECSYYDEHGVSLVDIKPHTKHVDLFTGSIAFPLIKELLAKSFSYDVRGQGDVRVSGSVKDGTLYAQLNLVKGTIRLPQTYNFINDVRVGFVFDSDARSLELRDFNCILHRGVVTCARALVFFDTTYRPLFAHVPFVFNDCLLNWKKDLFAIISGQLTYKKQQGSIPSLRGNLTIDRAQLTRNIFSSDVQKKFFSSPGAALQGKDSDVLVQINVKTKDPVRVKTSFLQAGAHINLVIGGTAIHPDLAGNVTLSSGSLSFPYRPLHITKGSIDFIPGQLNDPTIEMSASNKLKKYNVRLHVSGTLAQQQILLESSPPLTEEQIISLLLAGSHQESLNILMPALIMQNIKGIIFGSDQSPTAVRKGFGKLFKPFEHVRLVPSFTDQTGRGGLRGAVEIDVNERWHAMLQKNFSLTEDTRVEVEYLVSDDISLRGVRDERGDVSAEVEMRWKF